MRKKLFTLLLAVVASIGTMFASTEVDGIWYNFDTSTRTATVTYRGRYSSSYSNEYSGAVVIPAYVTYSSKSYSVTSIGDGAFSGCSSLTSVTIPNSITSIGYEAFYGCSGLTSVTIPNSITSIGYEAFYGCSGLTSPVFNAHVFAYMPTSYSGSYTIPNGIESIAYHAFYGCTGLTSVEIPNSVTSIGDYAFYGCTGLTSVTIPNSVTSIGWYAFFNCTSLISIEIPNSVTSIEYYAFYNVPNIVYNGTVSGSPWGAKSVNGFVDRYFVYSDYTKATLLACSAVAKDEITIPNSVTSIGSNAFSGCSGLTSVTIPNSVTSIGSYAFRNCSSLTSVTIPNSVTSIGEYAFYNCTSLISIEIPNSVTSIGNDAFRECSGLPVIDNLRYADTYLVGAVDKSLSTYNIKQGTKWIGNVAFYNCYNLTSVTIPNSVTSIGESAFEGCSKLTSVTIGDSVTNIGEKAFYGCSGLTSVYITDIAAWCAISFESFANPLSYAHNLYLNGSLVTNLVIPNSVTSIGSYAFSACRSLTSVTIPNSVTTIGEEAFYGCTGLTSVTIGNSVTSIGSSAFSSCENLISVTISNSVTSIGNYAFYNVPNIVYYGTATGSPWGAKCRNGYIEGYLVYSDESKTTLKACLATVTGIITIPNSVTSIGEYAFRGCSGLTSVTIPNSVTSIGSSAFSYCSKLANIYVEATNPPSISSTTFSNIASEALVHVQFGYAGLYRSANYWKNMNIQVVINHSILTSPTGVNVGFTTDGDIASCGISGGEQQPGNVLEYIGLEPESEYKDVPIVLTSNTGETETVNVSFTTTALELTTKASKPVSSTTAILLAETNMSDAEVSCGFEYKRNDAPEDMAGTKVFCPVASGQMAGRLKNLKDDVYYKYRAFYQSAAGNMYYGDWQYIFTGDVAVEFDPILYTYGATVVRENEATISGYALAGSEDFTEQGFEYWAETRANGGTNAPRRMPAALNEHFFVQASGISLRVTLNNLDAGTVYKYRVYGKVGDQYYYGSEQTFTTQGTYTPPTYTITFANWDGTELQSSQVEEGTLPEYTGATPERPENEQYTYSFNGWTPTIVIASADATYTATYTATPKSQGIEDVLSDQVQCTKVIRNGQIYIIRGDKTYTLQGQEVK